MHTIYSACLLTSPTFSYKKRSGVNVIPLPQNLLLASSTHDMGALCFSIANVGSTDSMARGIGSFSSTKLFTDPSGRPNTWHHVISAQLKGLLKAP
jgi:hypothetical protein